MKNQQLIIRFGTLVLLIFLAAFSRLIPHPANFTPIGAMALFGAAYFSKKHIALIVPITAMWLSDLVLNNIVFSQHFTSFVWWHQGAYWTYGSFILIGFIGFSLLRKVKVQTVLLSSLSASILFFLLSNFGVWMSATIYAKNMSGLIVCYTAAIPFFGNTLLGDLFYCGILFGTFELAQAKIPLLKQDLNTIKIIK